MVFYRHYSRRVGCGCGEHWHGPQAVLLLIASIKIAVVSGEGERGSRRVAMERGQRSLPRGGGCEGNERHELSERLNRAGGILGVTPGSGSRILVGRPFPSDPLPEIEYKIDGQERGDGRQHPIPQPEGATPEARHQDHQERQPSEGGFYHGLFVHGSKAVDAVANNPQLWEAIGMGRP